MYVHNTLYICRQIAYEIYENYYFNTIISVPFNFNYPCHATEFLLFIILCYTQKTNYHLIFLNYLLTTLNYESHKR